MEDVTSSNELWDILKGLFSNPREQRLAYFLFHCGLSPRENVRGSPQEFDDVREVSGLQRTIMERPMCHADQFGLVTHPYDQVQCNDTELAVNHHSRKGVWPM